MQKPIDFLDVTRILNGYVNGEFATLPIIIDLIKSLKEGIEISHNVTKIVAFTNRFAFSFLIKEGEVIVSKQYENCTLINGKPMIPFIIDYENPYFVISKDSSRKLNANTMNRLSNLVDSNKATCIMYKTFEQVKDADEFVFNTSTGEFLVFNVPVIDKVKKPRYNDSNREGYYVVYNDNGAIKMAFGDTRDTVGKKIHYKGYDSFGDANKRYKDFVKDFVETPA